MSDKKRGTDAERNAEQTRNTTQNKRGRWIWFLIFNHVMLNLFQHLFFRPRNKFGVTLFVSFSIFNCLFIGCKKAKSPVEPEKEVDYGAFYTDGLSSKKWVALTFDDGPKPEVVEKIFETLKKENVKATFFLVGSNVKLHSEYVSKYLQLGHEIGNHTYSHRNYYQLKEKKSMAEIEKILTEELTASENVIKGLTGVKPFFMRMPNGFFSPMVRKVAKEKKYVVVNWTFGCDWHGYTKDELVKKYLRSIEAGAIFLFHEKKVTAEALPEIISGIKKKGYEIVTLREILGLNADDRR